MRFRPLAFRLFCLASMLLSGLTAAHAEQVIVGSKRFTESYILGEIVAQTARKSGADAEHKPGLGNTAVVLEALKAGSIDVYPEYVGTIETEILKLPANSDAATIERELAKIGLATAVPLGFSNGYALAMTQAKATQLKISTLGDLKAHPTLVLGISQEFLGRADGWPGLAKKYGLPQQPTGLDHGLAYSALASGKIDVMDIYTTDAKIADLGLAVLKDEARYFPRYDAVLLYRNDLPQRAPGAWAAIGKLQGRIDESRMILMNGDAELRGKSFAAIATEFVDGPSASAGVAKSGFMSRLFGPDLPRLTREHLWLVFVSVLIATFIGVPLGAIAAAQKQVSQAILGVVNVLQTIPSLAMLAALIPILGRIGTVPAIVALSLYALLPIVRNTLVGLNEVSPELKQAGKALGMSRWQLWRLIELPLALTVILAGIKTAAVLTVGTATVAAFIGAGGYGERIAQGLALNDSAMLLAGAIPSAVLALVTQFLFELIERRFRHRSP